MFHLLSFDKQWTTKQVFHKYLISQKVFCDQKDLENAAICIFHLDVNYNSL